MAITARFTEPSSFRISTADLSSAAPESGKTRANPHFEIVEIIRTSQFGIPDISRVELDDANGLPRFNMPLEIGLFLGAKSYSTESKQKAKLYLILDT